MKSEQVKLVLAHWPAVEEGDQIWHEGKLLEVLSEPYPNDDTDISVSGNWMKIDVRDVEPEGYWAGQTHSVYIDMSTRVAVVVP